MNKFKKALTTVAIAALTCITGCNPQNETLLILGANTAGNLGLSAWFAIDDPDDSVKEVLKDIIDTTIKASNSIAAGESYVTALTPTIQTRIAADTKLTTKQKNLINAGASVILSGIDTYLATNDALKTNTVLISKVVNAFGQGCLVAINRDASSSAAMSIKRAHNNSKLMYDDKVKAFTLPIPTIR